PMRYVSFYDWLIAARTTKPMLVRSFLTTVAESCIDRVEDLSKPFALKECIDQGRVSLVTLRFGNLFVVAARKESRWCRNQGYASGDWRWAWSPALRSSGRGAAAAGTRHSRRRSRLWRWPRVRRRQHPRRSPRSSR